MRRWLGTLVVALSGACTGMVESGGAGGGDLDADAGLELRCAPTAGAPIWLEEGETASATLACATGAEPGPEGFVVAPLPAGASYDPGSRTLSFSPGLDQAAVYHIALTAPAFAEAGELIVGVADRFDDPANLAVVDFAAYPSEYGLPVIAISPAPTDSEVYAPVTVAYGGRTYQVAGKLRGASSLAYPKKNLTLDFTGDPLDDPAHGLLAERKVVLTSTFDDNSYLRVQLAWELWRALGPAVPVAATPVVVYLDGVYHGLYVLSDHIDDELMAQHGLPADGNLYKAIDHDANFRTTAFDGDAKATLHDGYEKKHGLPEVGQLSAWDDLDDLIDFVATSDDAAFAAAIEERVHLPDVEAWWLFAIFAKTDDSAGKNSYLHHSATTPWHVVPWDFNASFGQSWTTSREPAAPIDHYEGYNQLFARLMTHPAFQGGLALRFAAELDEGGAFDLAVVQARIAALAAALAPSAHRDERRWRTAYLAFDRWSSRGDFTTSDQEVAYLSSWVAQRWAALAAQYPPP